VSHNNFKVEKRCYYYTQNDDKIVKIVLIWSSVGGRYVPKTQHSSMPQSSELWHPRKDGLLGYAATVATKIVTATKDNFPILLLFVLTSVFYVQNLKTKNTKSAFLNIQPLIINTVFLRDRSVMYNNILNKIVSIFQLNVKFSGPNMLTIYQNLERKTVT